MPFDEREAGGRGRRLDSWKAIADYLSREVRSVQRWERERGLPVYRIPGQGRGVVFAYSGELDNWLRQGGENGNSAEAILEDKGSHADAPGAGGGDLPVPPAEARARFFTTGRLLVAAGLLAALAIAGVYGVSYFRRLRLKAATPPERVMLAILPFVNLSGDPAQEYFADGLTEEMITDVGLADPQVLGVIARTSVMKYKNTKMDIAQIGHELGANYVLEGSVRREGDEVRISAQLIRVSDQSHVWAQNYQRHIKEILEVQEEVAGTIAGRIQSKIGGTQRAQAPRTSPATPAAYDLYLQAQFYANLRTNQGVLQAADLFRQAIAEDPRYAPAYAGLADCETLLGLRGFPDRQEHFSRAQAAAARAIEIDPSSPEGHTALAGILVFYNHDWAGARAQFESALAINPNDAHAHHWYANIYLDPQGRFDEAIVEMQRAAQLDPANPVIRADLGQAYFFARRYQEALPIYTEILAGDSNFELAHWYLTDSYIQLGMQSEAAREIAFWSPIQTIAARTKSGAPSGDVLLETYRKSGYRAFWQEWIRMVQEFNDSRGATDATPILLPIAWLQIGDKARALDSLEHAAQNGNPNVIYLRVNPLFDPLRSEPRFQELERRVGLR